MNGYEWIHGGLMLRGQLEQRKLGFRTKIYKNRFTKQTKQTDRNNHQEKTIKYLIFSFVFVVYFFRWFLFVWCLKKAVAVVLFFLCFSCMYRISYSLCCWPHVSIMRNRFCHFYHPQTQIIMGGISIIPRHGNGFMAWGGDHGWWAHGGFDQNRPWNITTWGFWSTRGCWKNNGCCSYKSFTFAKDLFNPKIIGI